MTAAGFSLPSWVRTRFPFAELRRDGEVEIGCPWCNKPRKAWFNVRRGRGVCFACRVAFGTAKLISQVDSVSMDEATQLVKSAAADPNDVTRMSDIESLDVRMGQALDWPPDTAPVIGMSTHLGEVAREFCRSRGLDDEAMAFWGVRVCWAGDIAYRLVFPYFDACGRLVYWGARRIDWLGRREPKLLYPKADKAGLIYNLDIARAQQHLVLVEGQIDAIHVGPQGGALGGCALSSAQVAALRVAGFSRVTVMLDNDDAGRAGLLPILAKLVRHPWRVEVASLPPAIKDPGELTREQLWRRIDAAAPVRWDDLADGAETILAAAACGLN